MLVEGAPQDGRETGTTTRRAPAAIRANAGTGYVIEEQ
jgi:hypothetical protein